MTSVSASTAQILETTSADLVLGNTQVARDILQELSRTRCTLAGHSIAEHFTAFIHLHRTAVQSANVQHCAGFGLQVNGAPGVSGHRVEMAGAERDGLAIPGRGDILNVVTAQAGIFEYCVIALLGQFKRVTLTNPVSAPRQPFRLVAFNIEQNGLNRSGSQIHPCCDCHFKPPRHGARIQPRPVHLYKLIRDRC